MYILENICTYHKTQLHGKNNFTKDETNVHFRKQIKKTQNTFTSPETNLPDSSRKGNVPHTGSDAVKGVVVGERGKFVLWLWSK